MRLPESLICYNVGPRSAWKIVRSLRQIRKDEHPDAFALFEAHRALRTIRRRFGRRWEIYSCDDVILLVRKGLEQPHVTVAGHSVEWWGPKEGLQHEGREHLVATWDGRLRWVLMHGIPGGPLGGVGEHLKIIGSTYGRNRAAWAADARAVRRAALEFTGPLLVAGDLNATAPELADRFAALGIRNIITRAHVDHAGQRGMRVTATRLDNYGSDHPAIKYAPTR